MNLIEFYFLAMIRMSKSHSLELAFSLISPFLIVFLLPFQKNKLAP